MGGSSKSVTVGYKYYVGMHMILCHGMIDKLLRIRVDERDAWLGSRANGRISINRDSLFGGESREGGIVAQIDFENGNPSQGQNDYLVSKLGALVPAFRNVAGVVLRRAYVGMNPYLKKWDFRAQRIHYRQDGQLQWYNSKSEILIPGKFRTPQAFYFALDNSGSMAAMTSNGQTRLKNSVDAIKATLDEINTLRIDSNVRVDIFISAWGQAGYSLSTSAYNISGVDALKTWLDGLNATSGGTDFREGVYEVASFYASAPADSNRVVLFITDGEPSAVGDLSQLEVAQAASEILFATANVTSFAFNIDLPNVTYTQYMDNTPADGVPVLDGSDPNAMAKSIYFAIMGDSSAMNPSHIIRECLTDKDWGMGYDDADIDDTAFAAAADVLYDENMGISILWDTTTSIEEFVKEIVRHIDAALFVDRKTGKFVLKLIRDDFDEDSLLVLDENNIDKISDPKRPTFGELTNAVTVTYWNVETGEDATLTVSDIALALQQGNTNLSSIKYPGFVTAELASRVAQRDLRSLSTPLFSCTIYANLDAENLNIGSAFKLTWPDYDLDEMIMVVTGIAYGDGKNNRVRIQCTQSVFALPSQAFIAPTPPEWVDPIQPPVPVSTQIAFEVPYLELVQVLGQEATDNVLNSRPDAGYVAAAAGRPQESAISARFLTDSGAGFNEVGALDYCPICNLGEDIDRLMTEFEVTDFLNSDLVSIGTWGQIDEEIIVVVDIDGTAITVKRGALDTQPQPHSMGTAIFFWDAYSVADEVEYVASDEVDVKLLTVTGMGELPIDAAVSMNVALNSRAIRPYPAANVRINSVYFPEALNSPLTVAFNTRNRIQQTGADIVGWTDAAVLPETNQKYDLILTRADTNAVLDSKVDQLTSPLTLASSYNGVVNLLLRSKRDGYENLQDFLHQFQLGIILPSTAPVLRGSQITHTTANVTSFVANLPFGVSAGDLLIFIVHRLSTNFSTTPAGFTLLGATSSYNSSGVAQNATSMFAKIADGSESSTLTITASVAGPFMVTCLAFEAGTYEAPRGMSFGYTHTSTYQTRRRTGFGTAFSPISGNTSPHDEFFPAWEGVNSKLISVLNRRYSNNDMTGPYSETQIRTDANSTTVPESFINMEDTDWTTPALPLIPTAYLKVDGINDYSNVFNMAIRGVFDSVRPECYPITIVGTNNNPLTSFAVSRPVANFNICVLPGELEILIMQMFGNPTITPPAGGGWTLVQKYGNRLAVYKRITTGGEATSETWTFNTPTVAMASVFAFRSGSFHPSGDVVAAFTNGNSATAVLPAIAAGPGYAGLKNFVIHSLVREGAAGLAAGNPTAFPTHAPEFRNFSFTQASEGSQVSYVNCGGVVASASLAASSISSASSYAYESCSIFIKGIP